jgi:hypothetical protein
MKKYSQAIAGAVEVTNKLVKAANDGQDVCLTSDEARSLVEAFNAFVAAHRTLVTTIESYDKAFADSALDKLLAGMKEGSKVNA